MREFGNIHLRYWTWCADNKISQEGIILGAYFLSGPHSNSLGLYRLPIEYIDGDIEVLTRQQITKGIKELELKGFIRYCQKSKLLFIVKYLLYNLPVSTNVSKSHQKMLSTIPRNFSYFLELIESLSRCVVVLNEQEKQLFAVPYQTVLETLKEGLTEGLTEDLNKIMPNNENENENENENDKPPCRPKASDQAITPEVVRGLSNGNYLAEVVNVYHNKCPTLARAKITAGGKVASENLRKQLRARIREYGKEAESLEFWDTLFTEIACRMPHLLGGNKRGWKATLHWITGVENMAKVINGNYLQAQPGGDKKLAEACEVTKTLELIRKRKEERDGMAKRIAAPR